MIAEIIKDFDIFLISKSKLDSGFPNAQLKVTGFKINRYNQTDLVECYLYMSI